MPRLLDHSYFAAIERAEADAGSRPSYLSGVSGSQWNRRFLAALGAQGLKMVPEFGAHTGPGPGFAPLPSPVDPEARSAFNWWPAPTRIVWMHAGGTLRLPKE